MTTYCAIFWEFSLDKLWHRVALDTFQDDSISPLSCSDLTHVSLPVLDPCYKFWHEHAIYTKTLKSRSLVEINIQGCHNVEENAREEEFTFILFLLLVIWGWGAKEEEVFSVWPQGHHQWVTEGEEPLCGHQGGQVQEVQQWGVRQAAVSPNGSKQVNNNSR